jgi:hypothetical protein
MPSVLPLLGAALLVIVAPSIATAQQTFTQIAEFVVPEAGQAVGVDARYFYAVDDTGIAKYDKKTGTLVRKSAHEKDSPLIHLDGAVLRDGKLYAAHSNYPAWPMTSSLEVWDAATLEHVGSHSFGINWGSLTWADFHDGFWWMAFANYDQPFGPDRTAYGHTAATQIVKFTQDFRMLEAWVLPKAILDRLGAMSNSGGSWGPDGFLYLTGHDLREIYQVRLPRMGSVLELVATIPLGIRGQGIAWDRSDSGVIYGTVRATPQELATGGRNKIVAFRLGQ